MKSGGYPLIEAMLFLPTLPRIEWIFTPAGKRVQIWIWPEGHPCEMDIDVSDLDGLQEQNNVLPKNK